MYVYQLWNNEDGGPGPDEDDWDLMRLGYDLNASKDYREHLARVLVRRGLQEAGR